MKFPSAMWRVIGFIFLFIGAQLPAAAQGTAFTYQGRLNQSAAPLTGACDFQFSLWDAANAGNLIGSTQTVSAVIVSNGLFAVALDFGAAAFNGDARWLQVAVRTSGDQGLFTALSPRQPVTSAPYALHAGNAVTVTGPVTNLTVQGVATVGSLVASGSLTAGGTVTAATLTGVLQASNLVFLQAVVVTNTLVFSGFTTGSDFQGHAMDLTVVNGACNWSGTAYTNANGVGCYYDPVAGAVYGTNAAHHAVAAGDYLMDNCAGACGGVFTGGPYLWEDPRGNSLAGISSWLTNLVATNAAVASAGQGQVLAIPAALAFSALYATNLAAAQPGSNIIQNGSLAGSNALLNFSLSDYALDSAAWYKVAAGSIAGASNVNRFAYPSALGKIYSNQVVTVMFYANGWVLDGLLDSVFSNLTNTLPVAGYQGISRFGGLAPQNWQNGARQVNAVTGTSDPYWLTWYQQLSNVNASVDFINNGPATGQIFDTYQIDYITAPDGGTFKVQTNLNGGAWTDLAGYTAVSSVSATTNGAWLRWRSIAPANTGVRAISTGPGLNRILYADALDSAMTNGLVINVLGHQGEDFAFYNTFPPNLQGPLLRAWNPDLILMPMWGMAGDAPNFVVLYANVFRPYVPNAGVVICGQWPRSPFDEANGSAVARPALRLACRQLGTGYFDAYVPFGSYAEMQARGFISGDGTHLSSAGYAAYGQLLFQWLGLFEGGPGLATAPFSISAADFALNTSYTNGSQRAYVSACFALRSTVANAAKVGLYLDQGSSGTWVQTGLSVQRGSGAAATDLYQLGAFIQPGARFVFTNLSGGSATATLAPGSCQWTRF